MEKLWENIAAFFTTASADLVLKIIGAGAMLFFGFKLIRFGMKLIEKSLKKSKLDEGIQGFIENLLSISLRFMLIISILMYLGVPAASFIAILTSAGLAIGLALQGSLGNFAGGLMLLFFHPFRVGDYIKSADFEGTVVSMNVMYTQLATFDRKKVVVPNSALSNGVVTNFSAFDSRRVDVNIRLTSAADVEEVNALMKQVAAGHRLVLATPAPDARMDSLSGGLLSFTLRAWCKTADFWPVTYDLNEGVKQALDRAGLHVAPPLSGVQMLRGQDEA